MIDHEAYRTDDGKTHIVSTSGFTAGNEMVLSCSYEDYCEGMKKYREGKLIQVAFPMLNVDEREFLISGLNADQFDEALGSQY